MEAQELEDLYREFEALARESKFLLASLGLLPEAKVGIQAMLLNLVRSCGEIDQKDHWKLTRILYDYFEMSVVETRMRSFRTQSEDELDERNRRVDETYRA